MAQTPRAPRAMPFSMVVRTGAQPRQHDVAVVPRAERLGGGRHVLGGLERVADVGGCPGRTGLSPRPLRSNRRHRIPAAAKRRAKLTHRRAGPMW